MSFDALEQTRTKIATNPDIEDEDKELINEYLKEKRMEVEESTLSDIASRMQVICTTLDETLTDVDENDLRDFIGNLKQDNIRKSNGDPYSEPSKDKLYHALNNFYGQFSDEEGLMEDIDNPSNISRSFDPLDRPSPEQVVQVAQQANNLRDKAYVLFGWATGARTGELVKTDESHQYSEGIKWKDIQFEEKEMKVTLRGKTGERKIPIRASMPVMKKLWEESNADLEDPVFQQRSVSNMCPECGSETKVIGDSNYDDRKYGCELGSCSWTGHQDEAKKLRKAWTGPGARKALKRMKRSSNIPKRITHKPHWFFRDARALYWAAKDKNENFLRAFFGWSKNSDSPSYYIELMQESVLAGIREDYGETLSEDEKRFSQDEMKPVDCPACGAWASPTWGYCKQCGQELTQELREHNGDEDEFETLHQSLLDLLQEKDPAEDQEEIEEMLDRPFIEVIQDLQK